MKSTIIKCKGILIFDPENRTNKHNAQSSWKKTAMIIVNDDTADYYRYFIEKTYKLTQGRKANANWMSPPLRGTHVTIINDRVLDNNHWNDIKKKFDGVELEFEFDIKNGLRNNGEHVFYKVNCPDGQSIRDMSGLGDPYYGFHLTVGTVKNNVIHRKEHLERINKYMIQSLENGWY